MIMAAVLHRGLPPLMLLVAVLPACGGSEEAACGPVSREALDPSSGLHILPDQDPPPYATDPPTSGAHYASEPPTGVQDEALDPPTQVTILEVGQVLLQYRDLSDDEVADLDAFAATDDVVVAPNPDLPDPLVMTAWITKQTCSGLDREAVEAFVTDQRGRGPGAG